MWCVLITVLRGPKLKQPFFRFMSNVIAPAAFGLYLIHPLFRDGLHKLGVTAVEPNLWVGVPLTMTAIIIWTIALTVCIMRIPYLRRIVV
jgi:surface polysaccharide O-acyltransferase-like enzyme